jgi:uncharacterized metal-binding protein YceD (DUF177 family)
MTDPRQDIGLTAVWDEAVRDIPEGGVQRDRTATEAERFALAGLLELVALPSLHATYRIRPAGNGRYVLKGKLEATVHQTCVVSLAPLTNEIRQELDGVFWPPEQISEAPSGAVDVEEEPDPEPIENGRLPVGRLVFETLAAAIDPFPRAPDAVLDWTPKADEAPPPSPFAALAKLKK